MFKRFFLRFFTLLVLIGFFQNDVVAVIVAPKLTIEGRDLLDMQCGSDSQNVYIKSASLCGGSRADSAYFPYVASLFFDVNTNSFSTLPNGDVLLSSPPSSNGVIDLCKDDSFLISSVGFGGGISGVNTAVQVMRPYFVQTREEQKDRKCLGSNGENSCFPYNKKVCFQEVQDLFNNIPTSPNDGNFLSFDKNKPIIFGNSSVAFLPTVGQSTDCGNPKCRILCDNSQNRKIMDMFIKRDYPTLENTKDINCSFAYGALPTYSIVDPITISLTKPNSILDCDNPQQDLIKGESIWQCKIKNTASIGDVFSVDIQYSKTKITPYIGQIMISKDVTLNGVPTEVYCGKDSYQHIQEENLLYGNGKRLVIDVAPVSVTQKYRIIDCNMPSVPSCGSLANNPNVTIKTWPVNNLNACSVDSFPVKDRTTTTISYNQTSSDFSWYCRNSAGVVSPEPICRVGITPDNPGTPDCNWSIISNQRFKDFAQAQQFFLENQKKLCSSGSVETTTAGIIDSILDNDGKVVGWGWGCK